VFDNTGQVIGVVTWGIAQKQQLNFCVPADEVVKALDAAAACTPAEAEAHEDRQDLRAALFDVHLTGKFYVTVFLMQDKLLNGGGDPNAAMRALQDKLQPQLRAMQGELAKTRRQLDVMARKPALSGQALADLQRMAELCEDMQRLIAEATSRRYSVPEYIRQANELIEGFRRLDRAQAVALDVELP
jgi:hypothetical protein